MKYDKIDTNNLKRKEENMKKITLFSLVCCLCGVYAVPALAGTCGAKSININGLWGKTNQNPKDNEKYVYLIHCLFDEYNFYHQYPETEIKIVAELFGKIINNNVIDGLLLSIVLKYILEGIKTGKGTLYMFGIIALNQFIGKISHWPNFMNSLIDVPQIKNEKELYQKLLKQFNESKKKEKGINSENSRGGDEGESLLESGDKNNDIAGREYSLDKDEKNNSKSYDKLKNKLSGPAISFQNISKINNNESQNQISEEIINKIKFIFGTPNKWNIQEKMNVNWMTLICLSQYPL